LTIPVPYAYTIGHMLEAVAGYIHPEPVFKTYYLQESIVRGVVSNLQAEWDRIGNNISRSFRRLSLGLKIGFVSGSLAVLAACAPSPKIDTQTIPEPQIIQPTITPVPLQPMELYGVIGCKDVGWPQLPDIMNDAAYKDALWYLGQVNGPLLNMTDPDKPNSDLIPVVCTTKEAELRGLPVVLVNNPFADTAARSRAIDFVETYLSNLE